ncbi:hypothetical protein [Gracilibacillus xinjiangensis]|uniref:Uncharacterized protein n=1 Tax=Gracilibacillus xinjiangensis TaxID=1193282 RepID=A0ABV8WXQ5_9BACI
MADNRLYGIPNKHRTPSQPGKLDFILYHNFTVMVIEYLPNCFDVLGRGISIQSHYYPVGAIKVQKG